MYPPVVNSPKTELTELITDTQTEIAVADASVLLQGEGIAVLGNGDAAETIIYTSVEDNVLKECTRGFEGVARAWPVGTRIARNFTAADWRAAINNIQALHDESSSESRKPITLQPGVQIVKIEKQAVFNLAGLTGKTVIDYDGQKGVFGVRNPYVIRYGENLIPPFYEWTLSPRAKVINPYKLETTATVSTDLSSIDVAAVAGKTYTFSAKVNGRITIVELDSAGVESNVYRTDDNENRIVTVTFATKTTTTRVRVYTTNTGAGTFTLENPMLNIGNTAKPFKPREDVMLALQTDLYADPVTGANADTVFECDGQYFKAKKWQGLTLDGNRAWVIGDAAAGAGVRQVKVVGLAAGAVAASGIVTKFDGKIVPQGSTGNTADTNAVTAAGDVYIAIPVADSGWGDNYSPTQDDIKAYFFGYKAYDANTITPATAQAATTATWTGTGTKYWVQRVGAANFTQSSPQVSYAGYTPYKLVYQLATPTVEPIVSEGQLSFIEGENQVEVGTGLVVREGARPVLASNWDINATGSLLKNKVLAIISVYEDSKRLYKGWGEWSGPGNGPAISIYPHYYKKELAYSVTYLMSERSPIVPFTGSHAANEKSLLLDLVDIVQQNTSRVSVLENKKAEKDSPAWITLTTLTNGWVNRGNAGDHFASYFKDNSSIVRVRGVIKSGVVNTEVFRLPTGYRPDSIYRFPIITYNSSSVLVTSFVSVSPNGSVQIAGNAGNDYVIIDGIEFLAEQ
ncbi:hypothetical protein [Paenibacillus polymyxa]|uniref:hypothetical protein n=1 Tax=Paenibacillus polymyxa TaxID=1406 RepID=UPI0020241923|nr:hypothetical protein [Paenibacillus polymyxa]URJ42226.1 hypothetical protein MF627_001885 [Paenibacillus polymyxa]